MSTSGNRTPQHQRVEELCAGIIRALTGEQNIRYRGERLHNGRRPLPVHAPHLQPDWQRDDFISFRGTADSVALRLQKSDPALHHQLCPKPEVERMVFEFLEQLRVETMAPDHMPGMRFNVRHRFVEWSQAFDLSGLTESATGILLYTLFQICWLRVNGLPLTERAENLIEATRAAIVPVLGNDLAGLRRHRRDQAAYGRHARAIADVVADMIRSVKIEEGESEGERTKKSTAVFKLLLNFDSDDEDAMVAAPTGTGIVHDDFERGYSVFSSSYDRQVHARSLVRKELLREYRDQLDLRIARLAINVPRLALRLRTLLALPQRNGWSFGEEEGYIDGRRLAQLISSPTERRLFQKEQDRPITNCLVTFLVDCSGSMKAHAETVAIMIDVLVRALEQAGAATQVLGHTTAAWNGGRPYREWVSARSPPRPGRLNELLHMVLKDADQSWRNSRADIAALLKMELYREGVDGEAVDWACSQSLARNEKRRVLVVISDGCPMDSATSLANDEFYLSNNLKEVVAQRESSRGLEICALGLGLDLSAYYSRSLAINIPQSLNNELFSDIARFIARR